MEHSISAFNAKTHLSELLRKAENGESFIILRRGHPVAHLTPILRDDNSTALKTFDALSAIRKKISERFDIAKLIKSGRRY